MRNQLLIIFYFLIFTAIGDGYAQKAIFLHHSTGYGVYYYGEVAAGIESYNIKNTKSILLDERSFPDTPWVWNNYPYDYWKLWINGSCDNADPDIECLNNLATNYDLIIFKHCFPGAGILPSNDNPDVTSNVKTLENYKAQYRALRSLFDTYPDTKFMVWTLAPLHRLITSAEEAQRANEFVQWVKNEWLVEDGDSHPNIFIFDFFSLVAELNENPSSGIRYCLKYDYEGSHTNSDSHPNIEANQNAGPIFIQAIVDAIANESPIFVDSINVFPLNDALPIISEKNGTLQMMVDIQPANASNPSVEWNTEDQSGSAEIDGNGLLTAISDGTVKVVATSTDGSNKSGSCFIEISNQSPVSKLDKSLNHEIYFTQLPNLLIIKHGYEIRNVEYCSVYSVHGILMHKEKLINSSIEIDISSYPSGLYIFYLSGNQSLAPFKIVIRR